MANCRISLVPSAHWINRIRSRLTENPDLPGNVVLTQPVLHFTIASEAISITVTCWAAKAPVLCSRVPAEIVAIAAAAAAADLPLDPLVEAVEVTLEVAHPADSDR